MFKRKISESELKFQHAVLYFAKNCAPNTVGKVKLAKLLYYLDFDHFEEHYVAVTKANYIHLDMGPVPEKYWNWLKSMEDAEMIDIRPINVRLEKKMELVVAKKEPELSIFTQSEIEGLNNVTKKWYAATGAGMSKASHKEMPYDFTVNGEAIPYQLALHR